MEQSSFKRGWEWDYVYGLQLTAARSMDVYEHVVNRKASAGSIYMKEIRHKVRANSHLAP